MLFSLKTPKEWSKISRNFPGRTQHHIKNRFIYLLSKELNIKREKIRDMIKKNNIINLIYETIECLNLKKQKNMNENEHYENLLEKFNENTMTGSEGTDSGMSNSKENGLSQIFYESNVEDDESYEASINHGVFNVDDFFNFGL